MLKDVRYKISWKTIVNIRNKKEFEDSATRAGHIAQTFKISLTASIPWIIKLLRNSLYQSETEFANPT